eukprot:m.29488 g.29488  ORF g.29488 m.29488 type:complete len:361 (+) comp16101_c1_seq1:191-1273(+)
MISTTIVVLGFVAVSQAAVCQRYGVDECVASGCRWTGSCNEPSDCSMSARVQSRFGTSVMNTGVTVYRKPLRPEIARLCNTLPECTARYRVDLSRTWTSGGPNCNDFGMLPVHGVDQTTCIYKDNSSTSTENRNDDWYRFGLKNYVHYPLPKDGVEQSIARSKNLVTALTLETDDCWNNKDCAFPYGYYADTIKSKHAICVEVRNAGGKWVEIMAASKGGKDSSFCVVDMDPASDNADKSCTKAGDLVDYRESGVDAGESMFIKFHTEDNYDDANIDFHWRISASYEKSTNGADSTQEKDAEDWSQFRDGAQFPMALMPAYPLGYVEPAVFEKVQADSAAWATPALFTLMLAATCAILAL